MKKHLFFVLFGLMTVPGWAQVKVAPMSDSVDYKLLNRTYAPAIGPGENAVTRDVIFQKISTDYWNDFRRFLKQKNFRPATPFMLNIQGFFRADGHADLLLYQHMANGVRPPASTEAVLLSLLSTYLAEYPLPVSSSLVWTPFRIGSNLYISAPEARKTPKGAGIMGDLAEASRTTRPDTVKIIQFGGLDLDQVPPVIYRFTNAEEINLGNNYLTSVPAQLTTLPKLQRLNLMSNRLQDDSLFFTRNKSLKSLNVQKNSLTQMPLSVRQNRRLESLWLGNNNLVQLQGNAFRHLRRLTDLNLYGARLTQLPKSIGKLKRLTVLDLYYNQLTDLPKQLSRLKKLDQLALAYNNLSTLPVSISRLHRLRTLFMHHNKLVSLPQQFGKLTNLHVLDLGYNELLVVPPVLRSLPALEELDLNNNNLQEFPAVLLSIKNLKRVYLGSNPLFGREAMSSSYAPMIKQLEANKTLVTY